jgi:hypothetical protein
MKLNLKYTILFVSGLMLLLVACKKSNNPSDSGGNSTPPTDVYVVGNSGDTAFCWVNNRPVYLNDGSQPAYAHSLYVLGNVTYVAGEEFNLTNNGFQLLPAYWQGGQMSFLTPGQQISTGTANSVFCSGGDVYLGGTEYDNNNRPYATYWKNGIASIGTKFSSANSVYVLGSDIYLGGGYPGDTTRSSQVSPAYWKNGTKVDLLAGRTAEKITGSTTGNVLSVVVSGTHVYSAGYAQFSDGNHPVYWKDTTMVELANSSAGSVASSICVSGNDVYVTGYVKASGTNVAAYWKNNVAVPLSAKNSNASSIFIFGKDIYVAGYETNNGQNIATYWKNGVATHIGSAAGNASSVFVVTRQSL